MRQILLITAGALVAVALVGVLFTLNQANQTQIALQSQMQSRTQVIADSLAKIIEPSFTERATSTTQALANKFARNQRLGAFEIFDNKGNIVAESVNPPAYVELAQVSSAMDSDDSRGTFITANGQTYYALVMPLHDKGKTVGAFSLLQNATYIEDQVWSIWKQNLLRLGLQLVVIAVAIFALVRWVFFKPLTALVASVQSVRRGEVSIAAPDETHEFLQPLQHEVTRIASSLRQARHAASEEARLRLEKLDSPWTSERLKEFIKAYVKNRPIYVLSNREPYVHSRTDAGTAWSVPAGGVVTALNPVMEACGGMWIAHGSGSGDKNVVDENDIVKVPPDEPRYSLKRVWLTDEEVAGHYNGVSNEALWPLCHMAHVRPLFRDEDWRMYKKVNGLFAKTLLDEIRNVERPLVLVQDFHLALVPEMIKKSRPDAQIAIFWHIPWPSPAQFSICPWRKEILLGLLGADLIGFHTQQNCNNFIDTVANEIEARIDYEHFSVVRSEHRSAVRPFPISIAFPDTTAAIGEPSRGMLDDLGIRAQRLLLGVERLDYTKGIAERFKGFEFLLAEHPEYRGVVTLLQIASPSRESVEKYKETAENITREADRINERFATRDWKPIVLEKRNYSHAQLRTLYKLADVCLVTSLHDGMNLVAKEFVAARDDEGGVLLLSQFTGASRDLKNALIVNPYSAEEIAAALHSALIMSKTEQYRRMKSMRDSVRDYNVFRWSAEIIKELGQLE